jgi:pyrimidine operon attenuation protein/uracil phosphoribosyltransferase
VARPTEIPFSLEQKNVVLIDDVFYTGRTVRAGMEALMEHGRPGNIELLVLIDRRFSREIPIMPNYIGKSVDSYDNQKVLVSWNPDGTENAVYLLTDKQ